MDLNLSDSTRERLANFPEFEKQVKKFIDDNGEAKGKPAGLFPDLIVYVRDLLEKRKCEAPDWYGWTEEMTDNFYSDGRNSRYYILWQEFGLDLDFYVSATIDLIESEED